MINNIYDYNNNQFLSRDDRPFQLVIAGSCTTPQWRFNRIANEVVRNWRLAVVMRYQSGALIQIPGTNNNLNLMLLTTTYATRVSGVPFFLKDSNCHCFDPTKDLVLNPAAFVQTRAGQFSPSTSFYGDYCCMRTPQENVAFGRLFQFGHEGRFNLELRGEFTNIFNRHFYPAPASTSLTTATQYGPSGLLTAGYGFVNTTGGFGA